jgi:hypothetical protein
MAKSNQFALNPQTKLKLVATHKQTLQEFEKIITFNEWQTINKHKDYLYKTYQI